MIETLAAQGRDTELIDLKLVQLSAGKQQTFSNEGEMCAVVLSGAVEVTVGRSGPPLGLAGRDGDVFESLPVAAYAPPGETLGLRAASDALVAVASAPAGLAGAGRPRLIRQDGQPVRSAGAGNWSRSIRTILGPEDDASRLIVGETISPSGNWSSYPPHKHDRNAPPEEVAFEEVYYYRFKPESGFGVQLLYDDTGERAHIVHDGDAIAIRSGYHPVVAAPGYQLYYLWVMAGEGREFALTPHFDPRHAWVQKMRS
jgi:5-deoxy-glucuronate isomerase